MLSLFPSAGSSKKPNPSAISDGKHWLSDLPLGTYVFALLMTVLGLLLRLLLDPWLKDQMAYITFVLAVAFTGLYVGVRPALFSTFLGAVLAYFCFVPPRYEWGFQNISDAAGFGVYLAAALAVVALVRTRIRSAQVAKHSLEERLETQRKLADAQALLKAFLDHSPACAYLKDDSGRKIFANEVASTALKEWFTPAASDRLREHEKEVLRAGHAMEFVEKVDDGSEERYWLAVKFPFIDQNGHQYLGANLIDITDRTMAQTMLQKTQELKAAGHMASALAHEINNPLAGLTNALFLLRNEQLSDEGKWYLALVEEQLRRLNHITRLTLAFYKEDEPPHAVDIPSVLSQVIEELKPAMVQAGIRCTSDVQDELTVTTRVDLVRDLMANVLSNAMESGAASVRVRVAAGIDWHPLNRRGIRITVSDDGRGIAEEIREHLFEPFSTTKEQRSAGLGLWATKVIALSLGGTIRLRSSTRTATRGTSVSIFLPVAESVRKRVANFSAQVNAARKPA